MENLEDKIEIIKNDSNDGIYRKTLYRCKYCGYNALIKENMGRHVSGKRDNCSKYLNKNKSIYIYKYL
jgi:DNA-directed RNA polymerase subunit RPC12/RpoP